MAVTLIEKPERSGESSPASGSGRWEYVARVTGESNPETALIAAIITDTGFFWYNLAVRNVSFAELGNDLYSAAVEWVYEVPNSAASDPTDTPGSTDGPGGTSPSGTPSGPTDDTDRVQANVSLEIGGRPPKLYSSRSVVFTEKAGGGVAPDNAKLLNVVDGKVEGQEVDDPASVLTIDIQFDYVTWGYIKRLYAAVWRVNESEWFRFAAGDVAFMGCTLKTNDSGRVDGNFRLGIRPTETILAEALRDDAGSELPTADTPKAGWDYLEIDYADEYDATAGITVKKPTAMRIHEMLPTLDFTTLGIGG